VIAVQENPKKSSLSPARRRLVELFQRVRYGRIARLPVRGGEPVLDRGLRWTRTVKVLGENDPHPASLVEEFALRREVVAFFRLLREVGDGELADVEVRNGLPFLFEVEGSLAD